MSENWKLIESEKADLINTLENSYKHLKEVLKNYKKLEFNDDRDCIYLQGYADALNNIINMLNLYSVLHNNKGGGKNE